MNRPMTINEKAIHESPLPIHLVVVRNPFDRSNRDERMLSLDDTLTIARIVDECLPMSAELSVSINGEVITKDEWDARTLKPGEQMVVMPLVHGGDNLLGSILMIALAVMAPGIGTALAGSLGLGTATLGMGLSAATWGTIMGAGIGMAGSMVVGGLMAPQRPSLPSRGLQSYDNSPAYSWTPATTQQPGGVVNRAYGRHKLYGNIIAGYIENQGSTGQEQIAHLLIDLGTGPYSQLSDFKINDQPVGYYSGVTVSARNGYLNQDIIPAFNDTRLTRPVGSKVVAGSPVLRDTVGSDYNALEIVLICPNGLWYANDAGGLDEVEVRASVEISADGGGTWRHVEVEPNTIITITPGYWSLGRWSRTRVGREYYQKWYQYSQGSSTRADHSDGDDGGSGYIWRWMDIPTEVATTVYNSIGLYGNTQQPIRRTLRVDHLSRGTQYRVRATNLSADQTGSRYGDDLYLAEINEVMYDDFQYPRTVLVAVDALATNQLSGSIKFSCMADAAIVRVWNGSAWSSAWSNNPAWVCWDILTQPVLDNSLAVVRYDGLDPSRLNLASFYTWAQFCDVLVPDGKGGTEKRCTFDAIFDTPTSLWDAALEVCATARAQLVMRGTTIMVVVDDTRATPAQLFSVGNTAVSGFNETFLPMADRAASIEVNYLDAAQDYIRDTLTVVNTAISEAAAQRSNVGLRGVTRASQAWREAFFRLKRNELLKRSASLSVDIDALACTVGDLIWLQNDVTRWGVGGRAASGSSTTRLQLDQSVTLDAGKVYELKLRLSDDTLLTRTITTAAGTVSAVDVSAAFPSAPALYDVWAIGETSKAAKEFIVLDITRDGEQRAKLALIEYNASLYGLDSGIPALPTIDIQGNIITSGLPLPLPSASNIHIEEIMERAADGTILVHLDIHFTLTDAISAVFHEGNQVLGESLSGVFRRQNVASASTYSIALRPVNPLGVSPLSQQVIITHTVIGKTAAPSDVPWLALNGTTLTWGGVPDVDLAGYRVRWLPDGSSDWGQAQQLHDGLIASSPWSPDAPPSGSVQLLIKAVDSSGNESINATLVAGSLSDPLVANIIVTTDLQGAGFPGKIGGSSISAGALLADTAGTMWNPNLAARMWTTDADPMWGLDYWKALTYIATVDTPAGAAGSQITLGRSITGEAIHIDSRLPAGDAAFMWGDAATAMWSRDDVAPMRGNAPGYSPWPGAIVAETNPRQIRVRANFSRTRGRIDALAVNFDVPDRNVALNDVAIAAEGTRLAIGGGWHGIRVVNLTLQQDGGTARVPIVMDKSLSGPLIKCLDAGGTPVTGTTDVILQGY